jgi:hypothetical protein
MMDRLRLNQNHPSIGQSEVGIEEEEPKIKISREITNRERVTPS